jgi:hypothetical protein
MTVSCPLARLAVGAAKEARDESGRWQPVNPLRRNGLRATLTPDVNDPEERTVRQMPRTDRRDKRRSVAYAGHPEALT